MKDNFNNKETLRKFLLEDVPDDSRDAIEDRFLADGTFAAELLVIEDELIEDYLSKELSSHEKDLFEKAFLTNPRRREKVLAIKSIIITANAEAAVISPKEVNKESISLLTSIFAFLRIENPIVRYAFVAVSLLFVFGGVWFLVSRFNQNKNERIANTNPIQLSDKKDVVQTPSPVLSPTPKADSLPEASPSPKAQPETQPEQKAEQTLATIILRPVLLRDPKRAAKLVLSQSVKRVRLQLDLEQNDYKSYVVRITNVEGNSIWQGGPLYTNRASGKSIIINLPAKILSSDDYIIELSGVSEAGPIESFADYFFSVTHK